MLNLTRSVYRLGLYTPLFLLSFYLGRDLVKAENQRQQFFNALGQVTVKVPVDPPAPGQAAIDLAMIAYNIQRPELVEYPRFESQLLDRGLTIKRVQKKHKEVLIGPAAFSSWAVLGATLAHEVEVHGNQDFQAISIKDKLGLDGTHQAERTAYQYELDGANRFGLSEEEKSFIKETMDHYFPKNLKQGSK